MSSSILSAFRPALRGISTNLVPGLILQSFALLIVVGYYQVDAVALGLDQVGAWKVEWGYLFSILSTSLFGGLIPFCVLWATGRVPPQERIAHGLFYVLFWCWKGAEVDAFYRGQAWLFGSEATPSVIATKTIVDQFVYNPLWAAPTQTVFFLWKDCGFSFGKMRARLSDQGLVFRIITVTLSTWVVWIPAVAIIYSLPAALQIPLFNLVLCFWCLLLSFVSRTAP